MLNEETSLITSLFLKKVSTMPTGALIPTGSPLHLRLTINYAMVQSPEDDALIYSLALIDEDLSVQPTKMWSYMQPMDSIGTFR